MYLLANDEKNYPELAIYLKKYMPKELNNQIIRKALTKYGRLNDGQINDALTYGRPPLVSIVFINDNYACGDRTGPDGTTYGCFRPKKNDRIEISKTYVDRFEKDPAAGSNNRNIRGSIVYIVGATIFHELCHWGNYKAGIDEGDDDQGTRFELAVYGKCIWW
jgi:hypothetical protein